MAGLHAADRKSTERYESGTDWMVLRTNLTHGQKIRLGEMTQNRFAADASALSGDPDARLEFRSHLVEVNTFLFSALCESWSFSKEPTVSEYLALDEESGEWVDEKIADVMQKRAERLEGKGGRTGETRPETSPKSGRSATKSG